MVQSGTFVNQILRPAKSGDPLFPTNRLTTGSPSRARAGPMSEFRGSQTSPQTASVQRARALLRGLGSNHTTAPGCASEWSMGLPEDDVQSEEEDIQRTLDSVFDQALVFHGFADHMRDYDVFVHCTADPRTCRLIDSVEKGSPTFYCPTVSEFL